MGISHKVHMSDQLLPENNPQWKAGVRVLGIAESFTKEVDKSVVAGVVMRGDLRIDGFGFCRPTVGGFDATESLLDLYQRLERQDVRAWILGGNIISWFNVVDIDEVYRMTKIPIVCITYNPSEGIEKYLHEYFPDTWEERYKKIMQMGERTEFELSTGHSVYMNWVGLSFARAKQLVDLFTIDGRIPEPVRVARILAGAIFRDLISHSE